ncbi:MAG: o-succinylbenzoate synthase [Anaerolineales bacterium]|nr:o-succinylbenzoate synthase [Anaerolineales bacterium]
MKVERVSIHLLRMNLVSPFETSFGSISERDCILVKVYCEGLVGLGECVADRHPGYSYETSTTSWHILRDYLIPTILGADLDNPSDFQRQVAGVRGHPMAKAGLEMALWDLTCKMQGRSLRAILGGVRDQVEVGVSVGIQESTNVLLRVIERYLDKGYRRVKIKIKPQRDVDDVKAVRNSFPELRLQADANSAYNLELMPTFLSLDRMGLILIEQPLAEDDLWDHKKLQEKIDTPICLDESILSLRHARQALEMGACRIINIKSGRVGGLSQAVAIHDYCQAQGIPVWCGGMLETGVGRAANLALASLPGFTLPGDISASDRYYDQDITLERFQLNPDSTIDVPSDPGLGVNLDTSVMEKVRLARETFT